MPVAVLGTGDEWLALALKFAAAGVATRAITEKGDVLESLQEGGLPRTGLPPTAQRLLFKAREATTFEVSSEMEDVQGCDSIVLAPVLPADRARKQVDLAPLGRLVDDLAGHIGPGTLVVVACRVPPGTVLGYVRPRLERVAGQQAFVGVFLVAVPERVQGAELFELPERYNRIIGRADATSAKRAIDLYKNISRGELDLCDIPTAALVASAEGVIVEVHKALSTEIALVCDAFGASPSRVRELLRKSPRGGLDLPKAETSALNPPDDTTLLKAATHNRLRLPLVDAADAVVASTPRILARLAQRALKRARKDPKFVKVAVLGVAVSPNTAETANTQTMPFLEELKVLGFPNVHVHDPFVQGSHEMRLNADLDAVVAGADLLALMTPHDFYLTRTTQLFEHLPQGAAIVDARGVLPRAEVQRRGFVYVGLAR